MPAYAPSCKRNLPGRLCPGTETAHPALLRFAKGMLRLTKNGSPGLAGLTRAVHTLLTSACTRHARLAAALGTANNTWRYANAMLCSVQSRKQQAKSPCCSASGRGAQCSFGGNASRGSTAAVLLVATANFTKLWFPLLVSCGNPSAWVKSSVLPERLAKQNFCRVHQYVVRST
jgi:hypothetical protein